MWNRRKFLKLTIAGLISTTGIFSFLQRYKQKTIGAKNSYAALLEHEIDHLNGVLYIDYA